MQKLLKKGKNGTSFRIFAYLCTRFQQTNNESMNLYIRYFDDEVVVTSVDAALDFIRGIQDFKVTPQFETEFREYAEGSMPYPKRFKVRTRVYFIVIKTLAETLADFKAHGKGGLKEDELLSEVVEETPADEIVKPLLRPKDLIQMRLNDQQPGWYEATMHFKRVIVVPETGKFDYRDTTFSARLKAYSGMDCYNRLTDHLRNRTDIDPRSQFPSAKGKNFQYTFLGFKPYAELNV